METLEHLGLSALLERRSTDFLPPCQLGDSNSQPFSYWPNALTTRLPDTQCPVFVSSKWSYSASMSRMTKIASKSTLMSHILVSMSPLCIFINFNIYSSPSLHRIFILPLAVHSFHSLHSISLSLSDFSACLLSSSTSHPSTSSSQSVDLSLFLYIRTSFYISLLTSPHPSLSLSSLLSPSSLTGYLSQSLLSHLRVLLPLALPLVLRSLGAAPSGCRAFRVLEAASVQCSSSLKMR